MNKYKVSLLSAFVGLFVSVLGATTANAAPAVTTVAGNDTRCGVEVLGAANTAGKPNSRFSISNSNVATVKFKVTGPKTCTIKLNEFYFYTAMQAHPEPQQLVRKVQQTFGPGAHSMSVQMDNQSCKYQLDLTIDYTNKLPSDPNKVLAFAIGGDKDCREKPPVTPGEMEVCDLNSGSVTTIKEDEFDTAKYSKDLNDPKCKDTESEELPAAVASTGPEQAIASVFGLGGFAGSAVYYMQSRRNLLSTLFRR